jgi:hypothetical protein
MLLNKKCSSEVALYDAIYYDTISADSDRDENGQRKMWLYVFTQHLSLLSFQYTPSKWNWNQKSVGKKVAYL